MIRALPDDACKHIGEYETTSYGPSITRHQKRCHAQG